MSAPSFKLRAHELVDHLADDASWDDLMYGVYVRQSIEAGLADSDADRATDVEDVRKHFGLER